MLKLIVSVFIPGFYFFTTGAPIRGALLLSVFIFSLNSFLLLSLLPPFSTRSALILLAVLGTSLTWAVNIISAVLSYTKRTEILEWGDE